jgi:hypothetical protein
MRLFSALSSALAAALVHLTLRRAGVSALRSTLLALLLVTTPVVWFFATCVEFHALQLAFAAAAVAWAVPFFRRPPERFHAAAPTIWGSLPAAAHMTGVLWLPAVAIVLFRERRRARGFWLAGLAAAALAAFWFWGRGAHRAGPGHAGLGIRSLLTPPSFTLFLRELLQPEGHVLTAGLVAGLCLALRRRRLDTPTLACAALFLCFLPFSMNVEIYERGAYYVSLVPVCVVLLGLGLPKGRSRDVALALLVVANLSLALVQVDLWTRRFADAWWVRPLVAEAGGSGVVLTRDLGEWQAVYLHSRLRALRLEDEHQPLDLTDPATLARTMGFVQRSVAAGGRIYATRRFLAVEERGAPALVRALVARYGPFVPVANGAYSTIVPERP